MNNFLNPLYKHFNSFVMLDVVSAIMFVVKQKKRCAAADVYFI